MDDIVVAGAGPSGSFLAYLLARAGCAVRLVDKARFPRDKVCGGGISNKTVELLPFDLAPVLQRRIRGAFLTCRNERTVVKDLDGRSGVTVLRADFDAFLLQQALDAGARFDDGTAFVRAEQVGDVVRTTTSRGEIVSRYVVGADGVFSQVREKVFGRGLVTYVPAVEALVSVPDEDAACVGDRVVLDLGGMPRGYGWIFPKQDHLNVGVFSMFPGRTMRTHLDRFMRRYRLLRRPAQVRRCGFAVPVANTRGEYERGHVLLVGDAAGLAESFFGEGIYFALESARLAAEALTAGFDCSRERLYTSLVAKRLEPDLRYARVNARLFFRFQRFAFAAIVRAPHANRNFAEVIAGGLGHRACFFDTLRRAPRWMFAARMPLARDVRL